MMLLSARYKNDGLSSLSVNETQRKYIDKVKDKIQEGVYNMQTVNCAVCGNRKFDTLAAKDRYGFECYLAICHACGLAQTNPRMDQASYNEFYDKEYRYIYGGEEGPTEHFFMDQYFRLGKKIFEFISNHASDVSLKEKFVLEIGCGAGGILKYFRDQGCSVKGIDLGSDFVNYGKRAHDLDLEVLSIDKLMLERKPDIIIYSHVLEHILDLKEQLVHLRKIMKNDTLLYIEVPGLKNLHKSYRSDLLLYLQNANVYHFTKTSLLNLMSNNGFVSITADEYVRSVFKLEASVKTGAFTNEYESTVRYLKRLELMHKILPVPPYILKYKLKRAVYKALAFFKLVPSLHVKNSQRLQ